MSTQEPFGVPLPARPPREALDALLNVDLSKPRTVEYGIPMRDGTELAADVYLPAAAELPAPAIVVGTPYDKSGPWEDVRPYRDAGYVSIVYDVRGRGKSEGDWYPHHADGRDGYDVVEWVANQEWCDGAVGMAGLSYMGWVAVATMAEGPPHLKAVVPTSAEGRWQQELPYTYGCFWLYYASWFSGVRRRINDHGRDIKALLEILPVEAMGEVIDPVGPGWQEMLEHDTLDELWRSRRWDGAYDFDVPCLHVTGWYDREDLHGTFHHYQEMMASSPASHQQWLLVGPWSHASARSPANGYGGVEAPGGAIDMTAIHLRFFDRFLKERQNGFDDEPRVQLYDTGTKHWDARMTWPGSSGERHLFLSGDSELSMDAPSTSGEESYRYDPMKPNGIPFDVNVGPWEPPIDLADLEAQEGVVLWTSPPLQEDIALRGWPELKLLAATDGDDTEWHVKLADVEPQGRSISIAWGCLRASYGEDASAPCPVEPGAIKAYSIELTPSFHTFKIGHRIRVVLASSEYPWFARSLNRFGPIAKQEDPRTAINTVFYGPGNLSRLVLPVEQ